MKTISISEIPLIQITRHKKLISDLSFHIEEFVTAFPRIGEKYDSNVKGKNPKEEVIVLLQHIHSQNIQVADFLMELWKIASTSCSEGT